MQNSLQKVYEELRAVVDFSNVSVSGKESAALRQQYLAERAAFSDAANADKLSSLVADGASDAGHTTAEQKTLLQAIQEVEGKRTDADASNAALALDPAGTENPQSRATGPVAPLPQQTATPSLGIMEQQLLDQIAKGVLRGVQNGEHHLVLKLHPPELGEVKVDLVVHHDQVSVSFAMDNSKVKQAMENNMQQFRDNLAQRGFVLQNCFVSVGNGNDQNEAWRRFEQAMQADKVQTVRQADVPGEMLYQRNAGRLLADGSISVFI